MKSLLTLMVLLTSLQWANAARLTTITSLTDNKLNDFAKASHTVVASLLGNSYMCGQVLKTAYKPKPSEKLIQIVKQHLYSQVNHIGMEVHGHEVSYLGSFPEEGRSEFLVFLDSWTDGFEDGLGNLGDGSSSNTRVLENLAHFGDAIWALPGASRLLTYNGSFEYYDFDFDFLALVDVENQEIMTVHYGYCE